MALQIIKPCPECGLPMVELFGKPWCDRHRIVEVWVRGVLVRAVSVEWGPEPEAGFPGPRLELVKFDGVTELSPAEEEAIYDATWDTIDLLHADGMLVYSYTDNGDYYEHYWPAIRYSWMSYWMPTYAERWPHKVQQ
jgi:hypothetical protein